MANTGPTHQVGGFDPIKNWERTVVNGGLTGAKQWLQLLPLWE